MYTCENNTGFSDILIAYAVRSSMLNSCYENFYCWDGNDDERNVSCLLQEKKITLLDPHHLTSPHLTVIASPENQKSILSSKLSFLLTCLKDTLSDTGLDTYHLENLNACHCILTLKSCLNDGPSYYMSMGYTCDWASCWTEREKNPE